MALLLLPLSAELRPPGKCQGGSSQAANSVFRNTHVVWHTPTPTDSSLFTVCFINTSFWPTHNPLNLQQKAEGVNRSHALEKAPGYNWG